MFFKSEKMYLPTVTTITRNIIVTGLRSFPGTPHSINSTATGRNSLQKILDDYKKLIKEIGYQVPTAHATTYLYIKFNLNLTGFRTVIKLNSKTPKSPKLEHGYH